MFRMGKDTKQCSDSWTPFHFSLTATEGHNNPLGGVPLRHAIAEREYHRSEA